MAKNTYIVQDVPGKKSGSRKNSSENGYGNRRSSRNDGGIGYGNNSSKGKRNGSIAQRLGLLLWKNLLLRKRHWFVTLVEILLPCIIAFGIAYMRTLIVDENKIIQTEDVIFPPQGEQEIIDEAKRKLFRKKSFLAYVPKNNLTDAIMAEIGAKLNAKRMKLKSFDNEQELEEFVEQTELESAKRVVERVTAAYIFGKSFLIEDPNELNKDPNERLDYTIRLPIYTIETRQNVPYVQFPGPSDDNAYSYVSGGFTGLQLLMDKILIKMLTGNEPTHEITHQVFPYPPYNKTKGFEQLNSLAVPLMLVIGFIFIVPSIVVKVVSERETGIKELMKIMGLPNWIHWLGWMLDSMFALTISVTIVVWLFFTTFNEETGPVLPFSDATVWWTVFFLYAISATSFCFLVSVLSSRPTTATALGMVLWLVLYLMISLPMENRTETLTLSEKMISSLFPNVALHWAIKAMYSFETRGVGAKWSNIFLAASPIDGVALYHIMIMFVVDTVIFVTLTIYLENVLPSKYGLRKPWYYVFQPSTWISEDTAKEVQTRRDSLACPIKKPGFEPEPKRLRVGVAIHDLKKSFGKKQAVNGVSLKIYHGQITALVGHNGAGKTTTLSILTGLFPPSDGTAAVSGYDIKSEMDKVRESLGLCPQHNMLFDKLSVTEHLLLFGRLKGLTVKEARAEARNLIQKLDLVEKRNYLSSELSGGQKRKLSLGMALIGGSKVVILDECTSGMDPEARRVIWDLLLEMRGQRTIILTTHFMEEADILGDRIAIMASGQIKCCGTPMFLKKFYGAGYTLKLTTTGGDSRNKEILNVIRSIVPAAKMDMNNNTSVISNGNGNNAPDQSEMAVSIPSDDEIVSKFPEMFSKLNAEKDSLGIITIGIALTTMDQVFLKIGELEAQGKVEAKVPQKASSNGVNSNGHGNSNGNDNGQLKNTPMQNGAGRRPQRIFKQQLIGLFKKKLIYTLKKKGLLFAQFVMPPLLLIAAIFLSTRAYAPSTQSPPYTMSINTYKKPVTLFATDDEKLGNIFKAQVGPSVKALPDNETDLSAALLTAAREDLGIFRDQYMIAAYLNASVIHAMYSSIPYHSSPIAINLATNTLLKSLSRPGTNYSLGITYHPLENKLFATLQAAQPNANFNFLVPIVFGALVPIGLALFAASYVVFPTEERLSKSKQLQLMTGVNPVTFWGTSFVWDFMLMALAICIMVACFPIFETNESFTAHGGLGSIMAILLIYGYSAISFSYLASLFTPSSAGGFAFVTILHVFTGMIVPLVLFMGDFFNFTTTLLVFRHIFRPFSSFGAALSIMRYAAISTANTRCSILTFREKNIICNETYTVDALLRQCCDNCEDFENFEGVPRCFEPTEFFGWNYTYKSDTDAKVYTIPGISQELMWIAIMAIVYQILVVFLESGILKKIRHCGSSDKAVKTKPKDGEEEDSDVVEEKERISQMTKSEDALVVCDLSKNYGNFAAVKNLNFGVHYGECFGLLGVNGAGKTTSFRMLTGDESMTSGNAHSFMNTLKSNREDFMVNIGYCPQFDAIIGSLSGREMLELFCYLRGVPSNEIKEEVNKWLVKLGLEKSGDAQCGSYSGGMKRRLSIGIAMIGDPPVVLLDEPTSGVDPVSRRQFWEVIASAKASGQSVILTSHSMDEIEVLCSRLGIMVNGELQCLGSVEYLRSKFAKGYTLVLRLKGHHSHGSPLIASLKHEIESRFQPCELQDEHQNVLQYQLKDSKIPWDAIFRTMEDIKHANISSSNSENHSHNHNNHRRPSSIDTSSHKSFDGLLTYAGLIEDYTVSLTSLEEVFLSFARKQYSSRDANLSFLRLLVKCPCC